MVQKSVERKLEIVDGFDSISAQHHRSGPDATAETIKTWSQCYNVKKIFFCLKWQILAFWLKTLLAYVSIFDS
jgi:hypothetical protein